MTYYMAEHRGNLTAEWEYIGEGLSGEFDESDPDDVQLLRFSVVDADGEQLEDASYCTLMPVDTEDDILRRGLQLILDAVEGKTNYKRELEYLSWMNPEEFRRV